MNTVLVVDDTPDNITVLLAQLTRAGHRVLVASDGASAIEQAAYARPALVLLDVMMPGMDGFATCERLRSDPRTADIPVIFMTALDALSDKVRGFKVGAVDYISKPFDEEEVLARVATHLDLRRLRDELRDANENLQQQVAARTAELSSALAKVKKLQAQLKIENRYLQDEISEASNPRDLIGASPGLKAVLTAIRQVAPTDATVLICGETGTGKELVARAIHEQSRRHARTMVKLNCSAIAAGLVESELFGHVRGAFTGAVGRRAGRFELAHGGTLFLDEVSELPREMQAKLLRVLQEREFEPVGGTAAVKVDVRVIAATNRDLAADVKSGRFRDDLYYRLNVFPIQIPPLRERREDIPALANFFMNRFARKVGKLIERIQPATLKRLTAYPWPGNIRDLQNTIERAVVLADGPQLVIDWDLGPDALPAAGGGDEPAAGRMRKHHVRNTNT